MNATIGLPAKPDSLDPRHCGKGPPEAELRVLDALIERARS